MSVCINHDNFIKFEHKNELLFLKIQDVYIWRYLRFQIFKELSNASKKSAFSNREKKKGKNKFLLLLGMFIGIAKEFLVNYKRNPFFVKNRVDILFIGHPRRYKNKDYYECSYTDDIINHLPYTYYVIEHQDIFGKHYRNVLTNNLLYLDIFVKLKPFVAKINKIKFKNKMISSEKARLIEICNKLQKEFGIKLNNKWFLERIQDLIYDYKASEPFLKFFLNRVRPKLIIEVNSYNVHTMLLNELGKKIGAKIIELQHGSMGHDHIAYNFYHKYELSTFPDYIFLFGSYWKKATRFPINDNNVIVTGFPYHEKRSKVFSTRKRLQNKQVILFISSKYISTELIKLASALYKIIDNNKFEIIYKLHYAEYEDLKRDNRYNLLEKSNIKIVCDNEKDIYHYLSIADFLVAIESTVIYEALAFKIKIFIFNHKHSIERSKLLQDKDCVRVVASAKEIASQLFISENNFDSVYDLFWEKNSLENIKNEIVKIMGNE